MRHHVHRRGRWLHARISEHLEEALKREARRRRSPVSLVVRNVLEGALELVEDIVEGGLKVASAGGMGSDVYGWQELILNRPAVCARCETQLHTGAQAYRGLRERPGPPVFLCAACVRRLNRAAAEKKEAST